MSSFYPTQIMGGGSYAQLQVDEKLNIPITWRLEVGLVAQHSSDIA